MQYESLAAALEDELARRGGWITLCAFVGSWIASVGDLPTDTTGAPPLPRGLSRCPFRWSAKEIRSTGTSKLPGGLVLEKNGMLRIIFDCR